MNVVICGSVKESGEYIRKMANYYIRQGYYVLYPEEVIVDDKEKAIEKWVNSMKYADKLIIIRKPDDSIEEGTMYEKAIGQLLCSIRVREILEYTHTDIDHILCSEHN